MPTSTSANHSQIAAAVEVMRSSQNLDDRGVFSELVRTGMNRELAARLIEFLPMAYCRVMLDGLGLQFSNSYIRASQTCDLNVDPTWSAAYEYALSEVKCGIERVELLAIAGRSAEFQAVNELLNGGSKLGDLKLSAPILAWPETGPDD